MGIKKIKLILLIDFHHSKKLCIRHTIAKKHSFKENLRDPKDSLNSHVCHCFFPLELRKNSFEALEYSFQKEFKQLSS